VAKVWEMHKEEVLVHAASVEQQAVPGYLRQEASVTSKRLLCFYKQHAFCFAVLAYIPVFRKHM